MKAYIITTGVIFSLITLAHSAHMAAEHQLLATDPVYLLLTAAAAGLAVWAWLLVWRMKK